MQAMQYNVELPSDYDMNTIKERVRNNSHVTDGFQDLFFKVYLITEKEVNNSMENLYAPLYVWKKTEGMSNFIFNGYFDNIIESFGFKNIEIGITYHVQIKNDFTNSKFLVEEYHDIPHKKLLDNFEFTSLTETTNETGSLIIYNPDKWKYVHYTFFSEKPSITDNQKLYSILHISEGA